MTTAGQAIFEFVTDTSQLEAGFSRAQNIASAGTAQIASGFQGLLPPISAAEAAVGKLTESFRSFAYIAFSTQAIGRIFEDLAGVFVGAAAQSELFEKRVTELEKSMGNTANAANVAKGRLQDLIDITKSQDLFDLKTLQEADVFLERQGGQFLANAESLKRYADAAAATGAPLQNVTQSIGYLYSLLENGEPIGRAATQLQRSGVITGQLRDYLVEAQKEGVPFVEMWQHVTSDLDRFHGAAQNVSQGLIGLIGILRHEATAAMIEFGNGINAVLEPSLKKLTDSIRSSGLDGLASEIGTKLGAGIQQIVDAIEKAAPGIQHFIQQIISDISSIDWSGLLKGLEPLAAFVSSVLPPLIEGFIRFSGVLSEIAGAVGPPLAGVLQQIGNFLQQHTQLVDAAIGAWAGFKVAEIITGIAQLGQSLLTAGGALLGFSTQSQSASVAARGAFSELLVLIDQVAVNFDTTLPASVGQGLAKADALLEAAVTSMASAFASINAAKEATAINFDTTLPAAVAEGMEASVAAVAAAGAEMEAEFAAIRVASMEMSPFTEHSPSLVSQVQDGFGQITSTIGSAVNVIMNHLNGVGNSFKSLNSDVTSSMLGIDSAASGALENLKNQLSGLDEEFGKLNLNRLDSELLAIDPGAIGSLQEARSAVEALGNQTEELHIKWKDAENAIEPLKNALETAKTKYQQLRDAADDATKAIDRQKTAYDKTFDPKKDALTSKKEGIQDQIEATQERLEGTPSSIKVRSGSGHAVSEKNPQHAALEAHLHNLQRQLREVSREESHLNTEREKGDKNFERQKEAIRDNPELNKAKENEQALQKQYTTANEGVQKLHQAYEALHGDFNQFNSELTKLEGLIDSAFKKMQTEAKKSETDIKNAAKAAAEATSSGEAAAGKLKGLNLTYGTNLTPDQLSTTDPEAMGKQLGLKGDQLTAFYRDFEAAVTANAEAAGKAEAAQEKMSGLSGTELAKAKQEQGNLQNLTIVEQGKLKALQDINTAENARENLTKNKPGEGISGLFPDEGLSNKERQQRGMPSDIKPPSIPELNVKVDSGKLDFGNTNWIIGAGIGAPLAARLLPKLVPAIGGALKSLFAGAEFGTALKGFLGAINIFPAIWEAITSGLGAVGGAGAGGGAAGGAATIAGAIAVAIVGALGAITWTQKIVEALKIKDWGTAINQALLTVSLPSIVTKWLTGGIADILEHFSWGKSAGKLVEDIGEALAQQFIAFSPTGMVITWIRTMVNVFETFKEWEGPATKFIGGFFSAAGKAVHDALNELKSIGGQIASAIGDGISEWFSKHNPLQGLADKVGSIGGFKGMSIPKHQEGLSEVPYDDYLTYLHKGEMIVPSEPASKLRAAQDRGGASTGANTITSPGSGMFNIPGVDQNLINAAKEGNPSARQHLHDLVANYNNHQNNGTIAPATAGVNTTTPGASTPNKITAQYGFDNGIIPGVTDAMQKAARMGNPAAQDALRRAQENFRDHFAKGSISDQRDALQQAYNMQQNRAGFKTTPFSEMYGQGHPEMGYGVWPPPGTQAANDAMASMRNAQSNYDRASGGNKPSNQTQDNGSLFGGHLVNIENFHASNPSDMQAFTSKVNQNLHAQQERRRRALGNPNTDGAEGVNP